ncbi:hypothetical protein Tco_0702374 [Tanacetum coccineum]|uniref:Uncharacterized protein n=1 Tax=Tanacetum coccineum TaxID=301880 RepID=A0ABQ4XXB7_9ASTR
MRRYEITMPILRMRMCNDGCYSATRFKQLRDLKTIMWTLTPVNPDWSTTEVSSVSSGFISKFAESKSRYRVLKAVRRKTSRKLRQTYQYAVHSPQFLASVTPLFGTMKMLGRTEESNQGTSQEEKSHKESLQKLESTIKRHDDGGQMMIKNPPLEQNGGPKEEGEAYVFKSLIQPETGGIYQGYPLVSVEVLRNLKEGGEVPVSSCLTKIHSHMLISIPTNIKDIMEKHQVHVSRLPYSDTYSLVSKCPSVKVNEFLREDATFLKLSKMDDPNITMEEYIRLEEEKARKCGKVFNWETAMYDRIWYDEDVHDLKSIENEFPAIAFNDSLKSGETLSCEPTVSSLNDEIDIRILFDDSDDEDYTISIQRILRYGYGVSTSCTILGPRERNINEYWWRIYKSRDLEVLES